MFKPFESLEFLTISLERRWQPASAVDRTEDSEGNRIVEALRTFGSGTDLLPNLRLLDLYNLDFNPPSRTTYVTAVSRIRARKEAGRELCIRFDGIPVKV